MMNPAPPVFAAGEFRKATRSQPNQSCVMIARRDGWVEIRDDKLEHTVYYDTVALRLPDAEFDAYQAAVRDGDNTEGLYLAVTRREDGHTEVRTPDSDVVLVYTQVEIDAFHDGVIKREFDALVSA